MIGAHLGIPGIGDCMRLLVQMKYSWVIPSSGVFLANEIRESLKKLEPHYKLF
jgi:hypothetical protein